MPKSVSKKKKKSVTNTSCSKTHRVIVGPLNHERTKFETRDHVTHAHLPSRARGAVWCPQTTTKFNNDTNPLLLTIISRYDAPPP